MKWCWIFVALFFQSYCYYAQNNNNNISIALFNYVGIADTNIVVQTSDYGISVEVLLDATSTQLNVTSTNNQNCIANVSNNNIGNVSSSSSSTSIGSSSIGNLSSTGILLSSSSNLLSSSLSSSILPITTSSSSSLSCAGIQASNNVASSYGVTVWNVNKIGCILVGMKVQITWTQDSNDYMQGCVTSINSGALTITVLVDTVSGSLGIPWTPWDFTVLMSSGCSVVSSSSSSSSSSTSISSSVRSSSSSLSLSSSSSSSVTIPNHFQPSILTGFYVNTDFSVASNPSFSSFNTDQTVLYTIYVDAQNGSDTNFGNSSFNAFQTLSHTQSVVRQLLITAQGNILVYLNGIFTLTQTWSLYQNDSFPSTSPYFVTYKAWNLLQKPLISGLYTLPQNWTLFNSTLNLYRLYVGSGFTTRALYANGTLATKIRSSTLLSSMTLLNIVIYTFQNKVFNTLTD